MRNEERDEEYAASATECTGLVPALNGAAGDADCRKLYDVQPAKRPRRNRKSAK